MISSSKSSYSSSSSWTINSTLLASSYPRVAVRFVGTLRLPAFIHECKHIVMMNTDDDNNCRVHVNLRLAVLLTYYDGVDGDGVPW
ncbi:unnamed protein product [Sphagnum troendelagicum]|uniref:Uncharacterized protein n=1 Tax=Sphagnum troendelagicum TaxID=128251 RepID=A0ABP0UGA3_9BRYO